MKNNMKEKSKRLLIFLAVFVFFTGGMVEIARGEETSEKCQVSPEGGNFSATTTITIKCAEIKTVSISWGDKAGQTINSTSDNVEILLPYAAKENETLNISGSYEKGFWIFKKSYAFSNQYAYSNANSGTGYTLSVSNSQSEGGTITSSDSKINCGSTCSASYSFDASVTLTATSNPGYNFSNWSGDCTGTTSTCSTNMDYDTSITANYTTVEGSCPESASRDGITYGVVKAKDDRCWLDRNLGAKRVATSADDKDSYGWLFQWGRNADGHQLSNSDATTTCSDSDTPGHSKRIKGVSNPGTYYDWRCQKNDNLWKGVDAVNNPCPKGFRLPTYLEWEEFARDEGIKDSPLAKNLIPTVYDSTLKLPLAGYRKNFDTKTTGDDDSIVSQGYFGCYWSSTPFDYVADYLRIDSINGKPSLNEQVYIAANLSRATGMSVRCIKDK